MALRIDALNILQILILNHMMIVGNIFKLLENKY